MSEDTGSFVDRQFWDKFVKGLKELSLLLPPISCLAGGIHGNWKSKSKVWDLQRIWKRQREGLCIATQGLISSTKYDKKDIKVEWSCFFVRNNLKKDKHSAHEYIMSDHPDTSPCSYSRYSVLLFMWAVTLLNSPYIYSATLYESVKTGAWTCVPKRWLVSGKKTKYRDTGVDHIIWCLCVLFQRCYSQLEIN